MRWLLLKDLTILRRSPLQAVLLIAYPILIALLIGFAISREPGKPRVALLNQIPPGARVAGGNGKLPAVGVNQRICRQVECVDVGSRDEAAAKVREGDVLAALILPGDLIDRLNSLSTLNPETPEVEVIVNEENPLKAQARRRPDHGAAGAGQPVHRPPDRQGRRPLPEPGRRRGKLRRARPVDRDPRAARDRFDPRIAAPRRAAVAAPRARPGDPLRHPGPRQPRRRLAADRPAGAADRRRRAVGQRPHATAGNLRDRRRGDADPDLRHPAAGRRLARPGARGEHLRAADRRARLALCPACREGRPGDRGRPGWSPC